MSKIDDVSEAIGELRADIKSMKSESNRQFREINQKLLSIDNHLKIQNGRVGKLERFNAKIIGFVIGIPIFISIIGLILEYTFKII